MDITQILEQIKKWTDDAFSLFGSALVLTSKDGKKESLFDLYHTTIRYAELACTEPQTSFLAFSAIDAYLTRLPYLYPVTLHDLETRDTEIMETLQAIRALQLEIRNNPAYEEWTHISAAILSFSKDHNLPITSEDIEDLSEITPILLDALQVPTHWQCMQWAKGNDVEPGKPVTYWNMPTFRSLHQFTASLKLSPAERCIAFGMIEPLVEDASDPMLAVFHITPELISNILRQEGAAGLKKPWCGFAVLGVKRGGNIFVLKEPLSYDQNPYRHNSFDYYNRRASYMPYQVTFPNADKPGLIVRNAPAWNLRTVLDKEQSLWLPVMVSAVQKAFFQADHAPQKEECCVSTESICILPAGQPDMLSTNIQILRPSGFDWLDEGSDSYAKDLLSHLNVTAADVENIPLELPMREYMPLSKYQDALAQRSREAVARMAEQKYWELFERTELEVSNNDKPYRYRHPGISGPKTVCGLFLRASSENLNIILEQLDCPGSPVHSLAKFKVDGAKELERVFGGTNRIRTVKTTVDDGRPPRHNHASLWRFYPSSLEGRRPPVAITLTPRTPEDLALLMGQPLDSLDWRLRFWNRTRPDSPSARPDPILSINNPYAQLKFSIHLVMNKRDFVSMLPNSSNDFYENQPAEHTKGTTKHETI